MKNVIRFRDKAVKNREMKQQFLDKPNQESNDVSLFVTNQPSMIQWGI